MVVWSFSEGDICCILSLDGIGQSRRGQSILMICRTRRTVSNFNRLCGCDSCSTSSMVLAQGVHKNPLGIKSQTLQTWLAFSSKASNNREKPICFTFLRDKLTQSIALRQQPSIQSVPQLESSQIQQATPPPESLDKTPDPAAKHTRHSTCLQTHLAKSYKSCVIFQCSFSSKRSE